MMDLCCVRAKSNGFLVQNSLPEKPICWNSRINWLASEIRVSRKESLSNYSRYRSVSRKESLSNYSRYRSVLVTAMGKKNPAGNSSNSNSNSSSSSSGNSGSQKSQRKPLDWREFRALLIQEQAENEDSAHDQDKTATHSKVLPLKWAHPISSPENGCLLVATEKLDGVRTFERTVVLLLKSGTKNPQEGPFGVVINRPLYKKMKHMNPTNIELATTFADCSLHSGGPLDASMFLLRAGEIAEPPRFEEVIPGVYFGSRNSLDEASGLVKRGILKPQDFRFCMGYAGWQLDQLIDEIELGYWFVAASSANLIFEGAQSSLSDGLWGEILQLMGGQYLELSRKPKQDI